MDCELFELVEQRGRVTALEHGRSTGVALQRSFDRAFVAALDISLVLPLFRESKLCCVVCVGRKSSGDVYVASELALLDALAHAVSARLTGLELTHVIGNLLRTN